MTIRRLTELMTYPRQLIAPNEATLRQLRGRPPFAAYALMPFSPEFDRVFAALLRGFANSHPKFDLERADTPVRSSPITADILAGIARADVVVADLTGKNPNVFYELGIAQALHPIRHVMLIAKSRADIPFDLAGLRNFEYKSRKRGDLERLQQFVVQFVLELVESGRLEEDDLRRTVESYYRDWKTAGRFPAAFDTWDQTIKRFHERFHHIRHPPDFARFLLAASIHFGHGFNFWAQRLQGDRQGVEDTAQALTRPAKRTAWRAAWCLQEMDRELVKQALAKVRQDVHARHRPLLRAIEQGGVVEFLRRQAHSKDEEIRVPAADVLHQLDTQPGR